MDISAIKKRLKKIDKNYIKSKEIIEDIRSYESFLMQSYNLIRNANTSESIRNIDLCRVFLEQQQGEANDSSYHTYTISSLRDRNIPRKEISSYEEAAKTIMASVKNIKIK